MGGYHVCTAVRGRVRARWQGGAGRGRSRDQRKKRRRMIGECGGFGQRSGLLLAGREIRAPKRTASDEQVHWRFRGVLAFVVALEGRAAHVARGRVQAGAGGAS